jgi:hypothetical protein
MIESRRARIADLVEELMAQRAAERIGEKVEVLIEGIDDDGKAFGRAAHQGPDDGACLIEDLIDGTIDRVSPLPQVGAWVDGTVIDSHGVDLIVRPER